MIQKATAGETPTGPEAPQTGAVEVRWLVLLAVVALLIVGALAARFFLEDLRCERLCREHLSQIYMALELYQAERGALPDLAMFPQNRYHANSLARFLREQGFSEELAQCPASGYWLSKYGVSYVWNTALNGKRLGSMDRTWMLVEIHALDPEHYPRPHFGFYHVLYTDGSIQRVKKSPIGS